MAVTAAFTPKRITRDEALAINKDYVEFSSNKGDWKLIQRVVAACESLQVGQKVLTYFNHEYWLVTVSSKRADAETGDFIIRVKNDVISWLVTGSSLAAPVES